MGLTSALFTGLSGLNTSQFRLDVLGDNIANVNTNGFKGARTLFQTQFSQTLTAGSRPSATSGGTNPSQVGLGSVVGQIQRNFQQGPVETTGNNSDLAIDGEGFFILRSPQVSQVFSRDGAFSLSADNFLVNADGHFVQGFTVDSDFNVVPGVLSDINIPLGVLSTARATTEVAVNGTLDGGGPPATLGSIITSNAMVDGGAAAVTAATALTDVRSAAVPATVLFATGDTLTVSGIEKGGRQLPVHQFVVGTTGTTLGDYTAWLEDIMGINTSAAVPPTTPAVVGPPAVAAVTPGVRINTAGQIEIDANVGQDNSIRIGSSVIQSTNTTTATPFVFNNDAQKADGTSTFTSFTIFDSLGNRVRVDLTAVKEVQASNTVWRFYAESEDDTDLDRVIGTGTVTFDATGAFTTAVNTQLGIDRDNTGAVDPLVFDVDMSALNGLQQSPSTLIAIDQDGFAAGSLTDFSVGGDGSITGLFSNGLKALLGQIAVATFPNPVGLISRGNNVFTVGPNSGEAQIGAPQTLGAGTILAGAIELSNVDLARQFIDIITASTGFSAASRVISTSNQLLDELLLITR